VKWYQRAAGQGYADAQNTLGEMYLGGLGVRQSTMQAYIWFSLAADNNDPLSDKETRDDAAHNRDLAATKMTTEQTAEARRLLNGWKPGPERVELQSTEAVLKQTKDEAARATKKGAQAKAEAQVARQSKAKTERKLAQAEAARTATEGRKQSQADPLGTWLRGRGAWLR
jgi:TPR repeat protein